MRRAAAVLLAVALVGCGEPKPDAAAQRERREASDAIKRVHRSNIPEDAQRELEEAQKLLDDGG